MNAQKDKAIKNLVEDVAKMSEMVMSQLRELDSIISSDTDPTIKDVKDRLRNREKEIDGYEIKVSDDFIDIICLHKPVASDLRKIIACYRLSINLERIGDIAVKVFKLLGEINQNPGSAKYLDEISNMLILTNNMVEKSILSFFNSDIDYAIWTLKNDDVIDKINQKMIKKLLKSVDEKSRDSQTIINFINIKSIFSNIERIADHATNIAEASIYYLKGMDVRHTDISQLNKDGVIPDTN